jgi:hypothetical protein
VDDAAFDEFVNDKDGPIGLELAKIGAEGVSIAQSLAPVSSGEGGDDPGELRDSIRYVVLEDGPGVMIGSDVSYALYIEYGTFDTPAQPFLRPMLDSVQP